MKRLFLIAALVLIPRQALAVELDADSNGYQDLDKGGTNAATEQDPTVDPSAEIQAVIGAGVYVADGGNAGTATALATNGGNCDAGSYALGVDASGASEGCTAAPTAASLAVDDLITLSGVAEGAANLGAFTGSTIADNQTIKAALQALETFAETLGGGVDFTAYDDITWGDAAGGSQTHTFDTGAGTDPAFTVSDTDFTFNKPVIASSFSAPGTASGGQYIYFLEDTDNGTNYLGWGIYGDVSASRIHIPPLADPAAGQVMAFAVPGNQTMGDGTIKSVSVGTWIYPGASQTPTIADPDAWTMSGIGMYSGQWIGTAAGTGVLPAIAAGMNFTAKARGAYAVTLEPNGTELIWLNGTSCGAGVNIVSDGTTGATAVCSYSAAGEWDCDAYLFACGS